MKVPYFEWIPFNRNNPPTDISLNEQFLILLREDNYNNGATWRYSVDIATPFGDYIDNFWDTDNDWNEGQLIEVIAYAHLPYSVEESELLIRWHL